MWKSLVLIALVISTAAGGRPSADPQETLSCYDSGSGPVVVIIPSLIGSAFGFRQLIPELHEAGYRTLVVEPLGVGSSPRPKSADYTLAAQADRVAIELERRGVRDAIVIGHVIGGAIAMRVAYRHPELVQGVLSIEGGPAETAASPGFRRAMKSAKWVRHFTGTGWIKGKLAGHLRSVSANPEWVTEAVVDGYFAGVERDPGAALRAFSAMGRTREPESLGEHLHEIRCPVVLLVGGHPHDGAPPDKDVARLAARVPRFAHQVVPGVGSFIQEERPDVIVQAVRGLTESVLVDLSRARIAL
jgi:pimeloyl-ACP methyl ester carboxylesterase